MRQKWQGYAREIVGVGLAELIRTCSSHPEKCWERDHKNDKNWHHWSLKVRNLPKICFDCINVAHKGRNW